MANSDKDILITPNVSQTSQPEIKLVGKDNSPMYLKVLDDNTLSFEGTEGQVFSIGPTMSNGDIFSVNDISGIQSMAVNADGTITMDAQTKSTTIKNSASNTSTLILSNNNADAVDGPILEFFRDSASPADNDHMGSLVFTGRDDAGNKQEYGRLTMHNDDATAASSGGELVLKLTEANADEQEFMRWRSGARQIEINSQLDDIDFCINSDATADFFYINANTQRIGIGDAGTAPDHLVHIEGIDGGNGELFVERASGAGILLQAQSATGVIGTSTNHDLSIKTNGGTRLHIEAGGNVGIGTTSPDVLLDVEGTGKLLQLNSGNNSGTYMGIANTRAMVGYAGGGLFLQGGYDKHLIFAVNNGTFGSGEVARLDKDTGNLGIGTTSPGSLLHLSSSPAAGSVPVEMLRLENIEPAETNDMVAGQGPSMTFYVPEGNQTTQLAGQIAVVRESATDANAAAAMSFWTAANDASPTEKIRVTSTGNVGIGTTSPSSKLEVNGTLSTSGNISSTSANNYNIYWPLYFQRDNLGSDNIDMRLPVGGSGTTNPNNFPMPRAGKVMAMTLQYYGGPISDGSVRTDTWRIRRHSGGTADVDTEDIVVGMDTLVANVNANNKTKTVELSTPMAFNANDSIAFKRQANTNPNVIHEVSAVLWIQFDA